jgi:alkylhydroperoxidase/carboxymuconolactone decarboxylase family protein YurZ
MVDPITRTHEEGTVALLEEVGLPADHANEALRLLGATESRYVRDLKLNLKAVLKSPHLDGKQAALLALSVAANQKNGPLTHHFAEAAAQAGATAEECAEAVACASLLAANNVLYRFRHFADKEKYNELRPALRMNIMMNPGHGETALRIDEPGRERGERLRTVCEEPRGFPDRLRRHGRTGVGCHPHRIRGGQL